MPSYLTPGVYVEEVPSQSKPIEGVGTSIAAFVGLAPGGPVNQPMRISNWTQFARLYSNPAEPENGPFMPGAYLAHSVYGFFANGGSLCWIVRVGGDGEETGAALPDAQRVPAAGSYTLLAPPAPAPREATPGDFEGDVARREGMGGLSAVDEVTMVCMPDLMTLSTNGDGTLLRDLQGKMI